MCHFASHKAESFAESVSRVFIQGQTENELGTRNLKCREKAGTGLLTRMSRALEEGGLGFRIQISNRHGIQDSDFKQGGIQDSDFSLPVCYHYLLVARLLSKFVYCILGTIFGYVGSLKSVYWYIRPPTTGP